MKKHLKRQEEKDKASDTPEQFFREIQIEFLIHELKDPISIIETGVRTLLERREKYGNLSSRQEKILKRTLRNSKKAREMLHGLLEIGRSEAGCFNCCCFQPAKAVYDVLMDALETTAGKISEQSGRYRGENEKLKYLAGCGIFLDIAPKALHTEMLQDETKFRQIVGNLIKNAIHHRKKRVEIKIRRENDHIFIEVTDDGHGIEAEHHQMIFRRYAQIKENECSTLARKGHGLGLAGALILARALGGDIEVKSKKGKGATFRLILPVKLETGNYVTF
jgi:two-component system OmpR family sensor kinase